MKKSILPLPPTSLTTPPSPRFVRPPHKYKQRLTLKAKRAIVAYAKTGSIKKSAEMAKLAPQTVSKIINSPRGQRELEPIINMLADHRLAVMDELQARVPFLPQEDYKTLLSAVDILTKNHQLLSGNATENVAVADVTEGYRKLIEEVKQNP